MSTDTFDAAAHALQRGQEYPYDRSDDGRAVPAQDWAHEAARGILYDLTDRRGIKHGFREVDEDVRVAIVQSLAEIIRRASDRPADAVPVSTSVNMARLMLAMGYRYLQENAPEHLGSWERQHMADVPYSKVTGSRLVGFVVPAGTGVLPNGTPRDQLRRIICCATPPLTSTAEVQEQPKSAGGAGDAGAAQNCRSSSAAEVGERAAIEAAAKAIYRLFDLAYIHPWAERGNSHMQEAARRYARAALASRPAVEAGELPPLPTLPRDLLTMIGEYGMARTETVGQIEVQYRWEVLIGGIKQYASDYARAALAIKPATSAPGAAGDDRAAAPFVKYGDEKMRNYDRMRAEAEPASAVGEVDRAALDASFRAGIQQTRVNLCGEPGAATQKAIHYPDQNGAA